MAPTLTPDDIDDLIYFARAGETAELEETLKALAAREKCSVAEVVVATRTEEEEGGKTCLHVAAGNGHDDIIRLLLAPFDAPTTTPTSASKKEYLNTPNTEGNTALHWAAGNGELSTVELLIGAGASPALLNKADKLPLDLAFAALGNAGGEAGKKRQGVVDYFLGQIKKLEAETGGEGLAEGVGGVSVGEGEGEGTKG